MIRSGKDGKHKQLSLYIHDVVRGKSLMLLICYFLTQTLIGS